MSWPGQQYVGGGQIYPQGQQNQQFQRTLQMMHMQMQLQHKLQVQRQQQFNPAIKSDSGSPTNQNESSSINKSAKNDNLNKPGSQNINKNQNAGPGKKGKGPDSAGSQATLDKNIKNQPQSGSSSQNAQSGKGSVDPKLNSSKPDIGPSKPSHQIKDSKAVKPADQQSNPQKSQATNQKGSLMGQPPLLPNPPDFPFGEKNDKANANKGQYNVNRSNYNDSNVQSNRSDNMQGNRADNIQGNRTDNMQSNRPDSNRGETVYDNKPYQYDSYWQNQQTGGGRSSSYNEGQTQQDQKGSYPQAKSNIDYNKDKRGAGTGGYNTQSNYKSNISSYGPGSPHIKNMNRAAGADVGMKGGPLPKPFSKAPMRGRYSNAFSTDRLQEKIDYMFSGPLTELDPSDISEKKFNTFAKIFVGNIPRNVEQEEILALFKPFGEIGPTYINKDSSFGFITLDYKANAAKAVREVDNKSIKNRFLKVRFATLSEGIRVRNLTSYVSNEFLEKTFSVFGPIEACRVIVDDRGNQKFEGIVIFKDKKSASLAVQKCQEECYFLSGAMKPAVVTSLEPVEDCVEGLPETVIPQNEEFLKEREVLPHFADPTSFEYEFGSQWKKLFSMYDEKKAVLDRDFQIELERLEKKMILAKVEFQTEKLRKELAQREAESAQLRRHFGADEYDYTRPGSPGKYSGMETSAGSYDNYGTVEQGYDGGYGGSGYDQQYNAGYSDGGAGGYSSTSGAANSAADYGRGYSQTGSGYSSTYGRESYGIEGAGYGATENKFDRGGNFDRSTPVDASAGDNRTPQRPSMEQPPEPPAFKKAPEPPPLPKDPYKVPSKRPRY